MVLEFCSSQFIVAAVSVFCHLEVIVWVVAGKKKSLHPFFTFFSQLSCGHVIAGKPQAME